MGGVGVKDGKAEKALESVHKYLETKHGIVLLQPAYKEYHLELGEVSSYPPGYKETQASSAITTRGLSPRKPLSATATAPSTCTAALPPPTARKSATCTRWSRMYTAR